MTPRDAEELRRCEEMAETLARSLEALRTRVLESQPDLSNAKAFAERLYILRGWRGLSRYELAESAGVHVNTVIKLEQGAQPRNQTIHKLARALGVPWTVLEGDHVHDER